MRQLIPVLLLLITTTTHGSLFGRHDFRYELSESTGTADYNRCPLAIIIRHLAPERGRRVREVSLLLVNPWQPSNSEIYPLGITMGNKRYSSRFDHFPQRGSYRLTRRFAGRTPGEVITQTSHFRTGSGPSMVYRKVEVSKLEGHQEVTDELRCHYIEKED